VNWIDYELNKQHCEDLIRLAQQPREKRPTSRVFANMMIRLGKLLVTVGERLSWQSSTMVVIKERHS
jgi:hypothetical protein